MGEVNFSIFEFVIMGGVGLTAFFISQYILPARRQESLHMVENFNLKIEMIKNVIKNFEKRIDHVHESHGRRITGVEKAVSDITTSLAVIKQKLDLLIKNSNCHDLNKES